MSWQSPFTQSKLLHLSGYFLVSLLNLNKIGLVIKIKSIAVGDDPVIVRLLIHSTERHLVCRSTYLNNGFHHQASSLHYCHGRMLEIKTTRVNTHASDTKTSYSAITVRELLISWWNTEPASVINEPPTWNSLNNVRPLEATISSSMSNCCPSVVSL